MAKRGRPLGSVKPEAKQQITLRIDPDVLAVWKSTGPGWQTRMNKALRSGAIMRPEQLKQSRMIMHMTQAELAFRLGMTATMVGLMERGQKSIEPRTIIALKALLDEFNRRAVRFVRGEATLPSGAHLTYEVDQRLVDLCPDKPLADWFKDMEGAD